MVAIFVCGFNETKHDSPKNHTAAPGNSSMVNMSDKDHVSNKSASHTLKLKENPNNHNIDKYIVDSEKAKKLIEHAEHEKEKHKP